MQGDGSFRNEKSMQKCHNLKIGFCDIFNNMYKNEVIKMKIKQIQRQPKKIKLGVLSFLSLVAVTGLASVAGATYSLPADRSITWQGNVGVSGDIPTRTTVYKTLSPSGGNDTSAIQTAITDCPAGQVVKLAAGTFTVSSSVKMKSGVTLRGAGMGATTIKGAAGMSGGYIVGTNGSSLGSSISLSSGISKGSKTITTSSSHGWSAGDIILIDQLNNKSGNPVVTNVGSGGTCTWCGRTSGSRSLGQLSKVVAVPSSTTATLEIPLYWNYDSSLSPQATKINGVTSNAGIEDLTVDNTLSGSSSQSGDNGTVSLTGASNCWLLRVEAIGSWQNMVILKAAYRNTIRNGKFHEGSPATPINGTQYAGRAYGLRFTPYASANLAENNQFYHLWIPVVLNGATSGNVVAYNYIDDLYATTSWNNQAIAFHGAHPVMNLIEGNYTNGRLLGDWYWGSFSHNTFFRNRQNLLPSRGSGNWNGELQAYNWFYNFVGNVFGTVGIETTYELNNLNLSGQKSIYKFGYTTDGDGSASGNDPQTYATTLRHGNWDSVTNGPVWDGGDDRALPPSLYLSSKPDWWGTVQWPAIGPDVSPMYPAAGKIGSGTPWDSKTILSPPTGLKAL